jgi:hypothetical protein
MAWCCTLVIPTTRELEIEGLEFQASLNKFREIFSQKENINKRAGLCLSGRVLEVLCVQSPELQKIDF